LCSYSGTPWRSMEPEGPLPCIQKPPTYHYPEPYQSKPYHAILSLKKFTLILSTHLCLRLPTGLFPSGFPQHYPICLPHILHSFYMSCESHPQASTACYWYSFTFLYIDDVRTSQVTHLWASTAWYGDSFTFLYVDDVRTTQVT
jgi:hypothetical protein